MESILYLLLFFVFFFFSIFFTVYFGFLFYSAFYGAPYVPTSKKDLFEILSYAQLKPEQSFFELGCGDGRVTRMAVQQFKVKGTGIDINGLLVMWARCKAWMQGIGDIHFRVDNVTSCSFKNVDVIYMFLLPQLINTFYDRLAREVSPNTLIISHGFSVPQWNDYLVSKRPSRRFPTYYYRI